MADVMHAQVNAGITIGSNDGDRRPLTAFSHDITSIDQLECLNAGNGFPVSFTTPGKQVHLAIEGSRSDTLSVWRTESQTGFISTRTMAADLVTIRFVDKGAMGRVDWQGTDLVVGFDQVFLTSFDIMRYERVTPGFSAVTATVSRGAVLRACQSLFGDGSSVLPRFETVLDLNVVGLRAVRSTLVTLRQHLVTPRSGADLVTPLLEELLLYQLVASWPTSGNPTSSHMADATDQSVKRAMDYIEQNLTRSVTVREIAEAAGIGVRALQIAFKRRVGCSPFQYLISRRLDRVNSHLQFAEGAMVRQIAQSWGFVHMSDFARRYRERFGCLPSHRAGKDGS